MEVKNEKKVLALSFLGVITFIAVVVGATFAYFTAQGGGTGNINVNANTATTDNLSFQTGAAINLTANQEDFGSGMGNKSGSTTAKAILTANNATNNATRNYYVYLNIKNNDFEYTTVDEQAEILLKVTDPEGAEVTTLGSLERKTSGTGDNQVTGFDITTQTGLITIADNYEIVSTGTETQEWNIEVIFANLDSDQNANTGKSFSANLIIQEEEMEISLGNFATYITNQIYTGIDGDNGLYYHDGIGSYINADQEAVDNSYRFSGMDYEVADSYKETYNQIYGEIVIGHNDNGFIYYTLVYDTVATRYFTAAAAFDQAVNDGYLTGDKVKNYVCFGAVGDDCQNEDNLYRIIGVFDGQIKLIKATSIGRYVWDAGSDNTWNSSVKPDIYTILNETYYNTLESKWQNLIAKSTWQVGGMEWNTTNTVKQYYDVEVGTEQSGYVETMKIGLMYVSDYGYATSPEKWMTTLHDNNYGINNWAFIDNLEWTISRMADSRKTGVFTLQIPCGMSPLTPVNSGSSAGMEVRPSFYLESSVEFSGGDGSEQNPFRIVV